MCVCYKLVDVCVCEFYKLVDVCVCMFIIYVCSQTQNILNECKRKVNTQKTQITMWNNYHLLPISVHDVLKF